MHAYIFNIQGFSIHDGPGIRTTVFFQGCPLQCAWCHNPEGIPQYLESKDLYNGHTVIKKYSLEQLMEEIMKDRAFYDESGGGVTFSGGEPLMQTEFLLEALKKLREEGIHTAVDTSGYAPTDIFSEVMTLADLILFDLKISDKKKHELYTGTGNSLIHKNLKQLVESGIPFRIRIPLVSSITDDDENLEGIGNLLSGYQNIEIDLLSFHNLGKGKQDKMGIKNQHLLAAPDSKRVEYIRNKFKAMGFTVNLGG